MEIKLGQQYNVGEKDTILGQQYDVGEKRTQEKQKQRQYSTPPSIVLSGWQDNTIFYTTPPPIGNFIQHCSVCVSLLRVRF